MPKPNATDPDPDQISKLIGLYNQGKLNAALQQGNTLAQRHPNSHLLANLLGAIYSDLGQKKEAIDNFRRSLQIEPRNATTYFNFGVALNRFGEHNNAATCFQKFLELQPGDVETHNMLGLTYKYLGLNDRAISCYQRALTLNPKFAEAYYNLGLALKDANRHQDAVLSMRKAIDLDNNYTAARSSLYHQLGHICAWEQIEEITQGNLTLFEPGHSEKTAPSPFSLLTLTDDAGFHRRLAEAFATSHFKPNSALGPISELVAINHLKIGYFSADFHDHATMYLMAELFEQHDHSKFEIHAFSFGPDRQDEMRARLQKNVAAFHDVRLKGDAEIASLARSLGIDIAVNLKGYTKNARPGIFAYRAAPIQVNYLGYPGTMGAPYYDYIIADATVIPQTHQKFYTEKIVYLPDSYQVNDSTRAIASTTMGRREFNLPDEAFVFCCFNSNYKITPDVFDIWMRLLDKVAGSVLWLLYSNLEAEKNLRKEASKRGIDHQRLVFARRLPVSEHLARHQFADLFLDTFNCNAHTTASDALWAGLPILTKMGQGFASRVAGSLLNAVEIPELITTTPQQYENRALHLATHPDELQDLKQRLKHKLKTAPLYKPALFSRHIEAAFVQMVNNLNQGRGPDHIYIHN